MLRSTEVLASDLTVSSSSLNFGVAVGDKIQLIWPNLIPLDRK